MKYSIFPALFLVVLMMAAGCGNSTGGGGPAPGSVTVTGTVLDSRNNPVPFATVTIMSTPLTTTTDLNGRFQADIEEGEHSLAVAGSGLIFIDTFFTVPQGGGDLGVFNPTEAGGYWPWYGDGDGDSYGDVHHVLVSQTRPGGGYTVDFTDCDDTESGVNPGAAEICNAVDDNCDLVVDEGFDNDGDSWTTCAGDCDDTLASVNPDATETCNGVDDNCTGGVDEGVLLDFYQDGDGDTFGSAAFSTQACTAPDGYVADSTDCDDTDALVNSSAEEVCNQVDDNCDGQTDEGLLVAFYQDFDSDGYGDPSVEQTACTAPTGFVDNDQDCNDADSQINPGVEEVCDGIDNNCVGGVDEGLLTTYYQDSDSDTYGDPATYVDACSQPTGFVTDGTDCDDGDPSVNPAAAEICDGIDNNCVAGVDEGLLTTYYQDTDSDTYGDPATYVDACSQPSGYVTDNTDCDDTDPDVHPGAVEVCDTKDNDCSGTADEGLLVTFYQDLDSDTFGAPAASTQACTQPGGYVTDNTDCDDGNASVNPAALEVCDGVDNNCAGGIDEGVLVTYYLDGDGDSYGTTGATEQACSAPAGYVDNNLDCDDGNAAIYPGATEVCNGVDDNCADGADEGVTTTYYFDADGDGYGNPGASQEACSQPLNFVQDDQDCDDTDANINPETVWYADNDSDQWPTSTSPVTDCGPLSGSIPGHLVNNFDCDDTTATRSPGNLEIRENAIDDDCNPATGDSPANYGMADLAGTWNIVGVNAGDYADSQWNGWVDGFITFDDKGQYLDYSLNYDNGDVETTPSFTQVWVHPDGTITTTEAPEMHGALSQDKDTIVATFTDPEGGYTMYLLQKQTPAVVLNDFVGLWYGAGISAADSPGFSGWMKGSFDVQADGMALINNIDSAGNVEDGYVYTGLELNGVLADPEITRYIAPDGQMVVGRGDYRDGSILTTLIRAGGAFLPGNLAGDWSFHVLSAGDAPQINGWGHGMMNFDGSGNGLVNFQSWSDPAAAIDLGTLSVDGAGTIVSDTLPDFEGHLSINKDTITATFTNDSGGGSLLIALRRDQPFLGVVPEEHNSVSAVIGSAGGSLQTVSDDGVQYDLIIPPYAFEDTGLELTIKMTPISALDNLPVSGSYLGAVQLAPEGLLLAETAFLQVTAPGILDSAEPLSYLYEGSGDRFHFTPMLPSFLYTSAGYSTVLIPVDHFSGGGAATGTGTDVSHISDALSSDASSAAVFYANLLASALKDMAEAGIPDFNDPSSGPFLSRIQLVLYDWYDSYVHPLLLFADTMEEMKRAAKEFYNWAAAIDALVHEWGIFATWDETAQVYVIDYDSIYPNSITLTSDAMEANLDSQIDALETECNDLAYTCVPSGTDPTECKDESTFCNAWATFLRAVPWILFKNETSQSWPFTDMTQRDITTFCGSMASKVVAKIDVEPEYTNLSLGQEASLQNYYITWEALHIGGDADSQEITNWISTDPSIVSVSNDGVARAESPGMAFVTGMDPTTCAFDQVTVQVGNPFQGVWDINVYKRGTNTCDTIPYPATPGTIAMDVNGSNVSWTQSNPYYFNMTGTAVDYKVRLGGETAAPFMTQTCDLRLTSGNEIKGDCTYTVIEDLTGPCSGEWSFRGTRQDALP